MNFCNLINGAISSLESPHHLGICNFAQSDRSPEHSRPWRLLSSRIFQWVLSLFNQSWSLSKSPCSLDSSTPITSRSRVSFSVLEPTSFLLAQCKRIISQRALSSRSRLHFLLPRFQWQKGSIKAPDSSHNSLEYLLLRKSKKNILIPTQLLFGTLLVKFYQKYWRTGHFSTCRRIQQSLKVSKL